MRSRHGHIRCEILACGLRILNPIRLESDAAHQPTGGQSWATQEALDLMAALEGLLSAYNYDYSDSQSDYFNCRFYKSVEFAMALTHAERKAWEAEREAKAKALDAHGEAISVLVGAES